MSSGEAEQKEPVAKYPFGEIVTVPESERAFQDGLEQYARKIDYAWYSQFSRCVVMKPIPCPAEIMEKMKDEMTGNAK